MTDNSTTASSAQCSDRMSVLPIVMYKISLPLPHARHPQPHPAQLLYVPYTREGYQAGDSGSEGAACAWVQVPSAG